MPALATLLYLDSRYFSSLASERWIRELLRLSKQRRVRRNDKAALKLLLDCQVQHWCDLPGETYQNMLLTLAARNPGEPLYLDLLARYFGQVVQDYPQAIRYHQQLLTVHPNYLEARAGLVAWHNRNGDRAQMLEELGILLGLDSGPARVQYIKNSFEPDTS